MKKLATLLLAFVMVFSLAACGEEKPKEDAPKEETEKTESTDEDANKDTEENKDAEENTEVVAIEVALVTDTGGIDDKSFNQSAWEGVQRFYTDNELDVEMAAYMQSGAEADYVPNLSAFGDEAKDLIVAPGFMFKDAVNEVSKNYPEVKFLLIDNVADEANTNVVSATFAENEGSFLVGVVSALKTKEAGKDKVGFIGGMDIPVIQNFEAGFEAGVAAVDPEMEVVVEYAGDFADPGKGQTIASKLYSNGCYVVFHAAGGTGNGLIKEAMDRVKNGEDVWACGVDKDQYEDGIYEGEKSVVLTSMMKKVDVAAYDVAKSVLNDEFKGGEMLRFNLENSGVGLPAENPNLTDEWIQQADEYAQKIIAGEIEVPSQPTRMAE